MEWITPIWNAVRWGTLLTIIICIGSIWTHATEFCLSWTGHWKCAAVVMNSLWAIRLHGAIWCFIVAWRTSTWRTSPSSAAILNLWVSGHGSLPIQESCIICIIVATLCGKPTRNFEFCPETKEGENFTIYAKRVQEIFYCWCLLNNIIHLNS